MLTTIEALPKAFKLAELILHPRTGRNSSTATGSDPYRYFLLSAKASGC